MCFNFNNTFEKLEFFCNARGGGMDGSADRRKREGESVGVAPKLLETKFKT